MARGKSPKPTPGQQVRINDGVNMPEFEDLSIAGWTGRIMETTGAGAKMKIILEWDDHVVAQIPANYRSHCESQGLTCEMACLPVGELSVVE